MRRLGIYVFFVCIFMNVFAISVVAQSRDQDQVSLEEYHEHVQKFDVWQNEGLQRILSLSVDFPSANWGRLIRLVELKRLLNITSWEADDDELKMKVRCGIVACWCLCGVQSVQGSSFPVMQKL